MSTAHSRARRALLPVLLAGAGLAVLTNLPSTAQPSAENASTDTSYRPVDGDGALPLHHPVLQESGAPPTADERGYAIRLARAAMPVAARDVLGQPGGEVVGADLPAPSERRPGRRLTVSIYDYAAGQVHQMLVDLSSNSVTAHRTSSRVHLPPTAAEASTAFQLALTATNSPAFVRQFEEITGGPLHSLEQVNIVAGTWRRPSDGTAPSERTQNCQYHRCVQLLLALPSGHYLNTRDFVVDLSRGVVLPLTDTDPAHEH